MTLGRDNAGYSALLRFRNGWRASWTAFSELREAELERIHERLDDLEHEQPQKDKVIRICTKVSRPVSSIVRMSSLRLWMTIPKRVWPEMCGDELRRLQCKPSTSANVRPKYAHQNIAKTTTELAKRVYPTRTTFPRLSLSI